ncbi:hypothetical protein Q4Q35_15360 [Flavivirga aquimarina]|uniref:Lipoprotein n=1 Tax=Flavivirga aquimarina TaxID=2027862 RepID=A0ABT8WDU8_9FLAO|nr:hypothetical protein [Flavivirga aquimarina]MDO5971186.1 hypothetical protein [Flavivirga aquimarina]
MKKQITILLGISLFFVSCQTEKLDNTENAVFGDENISSDKRDKEKEPKALSECKVIDLNRCDGVQPSGNFWWPSHPTDWNNGYFGSTDDHHMTFTTYDDGTASIKGATVLGSCVVEVDVWLKDKKDWVTFSADGGSFKDEPNDCTNVVKEDLYYYVIDSSKSTITASGGDCLEEGTFGVEQRPDPNDLNTPHLGVLVGPGAGLFDDSDPTKDGLSTWGWLTNDSGERLWIFDFNFNFECEEEGEGGCETAFAKGNSDNDSTCFIEDGFNRWGWTIGPLSEGEYTYDIYAGAGQCDTDKGALVGTADVKYDNGEVTVTYNIDDAYTVSETHTYAGKNSYPTKKGEDTVAPGQYTITPNLSGDIYVIGHIVVCEQ